MNRRSTVLLVLAGIAALAAGCDALRVGSPIGPGVSNFSATSRLAMITAPSVNKLYLMNLQTNRVNLQLDTGTTPVGVAVSPSGKQVLVTNYNDGTVSVYWREDGDSYTPLGAVGSGIQPLGVAYNPNPNISEAYVAYYGDGRIVVLDTRAVRQRPTIQQVISLPGLDSRPAPRKIAVSPDGSRLFVTDGANDVIYTLTRTGSAATGTFAPVASAKFPNPQNVDLHGIVALKNGLVFAANRAGSNLFVFNGANNQIVGEVNLQDRTSSLRSPVVGPMNIAMNPQGTKMFVTGNAGSVISEVTLQTNGQAALSQNIPVFTGNQATASSPYGVAFTADGAMAYVTNEGGRNLSLINSTPDITFKSTLFKNIGTAASASELVPLNEIAMVGDAVNYATNPTTGTPAGQPISTSPGTIPGTVR